MLRATAHIDRRCIERVLDVRRVEFLDHLHARPAVLRDLVDVRALHQPHTYIGVPQAVGGAAVSVTIELEIRAAQYAVE